MLRAIAFARAETRSNAKLGNGWSVPHGDIMQSTAARISNCKFTWVACPPSVVASTNVVPACSPVGVWPGFDPSAGPQGVQGVFLATINSATSAARSLKVLGCCLSESTGFSDFEILSFCWTTSCYHTRQGKRSLYLSSVRVIALTPQRGDSPSLRLTLLLTFLSWKIRRVLSGFLLDCPVSRERYLLHVTGKERCSRTYPFYLKQTVFLFLALFSSCQLHRAVRYSVPERLTYRSNTNPSPDFAS